DADGAQFSRQWADYLDQACDELLQRLPAMANVVAGPIAALSPEREWGETAGSPFDLLIIDEAQRLTESELLALAAHAPRLTLVSEAAADLAPPAAGRAPRSLHGLAPLAACWPRLWQALGDDLGRLPYAWRREANRLVCDLATIRPDDARHLE